MHLSSFLAFAFFSLLCAIHASGVIISDPSALSPNGYDYVIIGGGTAGFVVANRLTENSTMNILVLEAGIGDEGVLQMPIPFMGPILTPETEFGWNYTVAPQIGLNNRTFLYPRGRVLGGCSSVNYLIHQFGTDEDWNRIANLTSEPTWSWVNMKPYVQKYENFVPPLDGHNTTGQFIPSLHGFSGMVDASLPALNVTIDSRVMATLGQLPEFTYNEDMSGGDQSPLGIGFIQSSAGGGIRSSSYTSYYITAAGRPNFTVLTSVIVTNIIQTGTTPAGLKSFRSVRFLTSSGIPVTINARREIILSAGSIGTPKILQLSGIGNAADLGKLNIPVLINNTDVGNNLYDHTLLPNIFIVKDANANKTFDNLLRNPTQIGIQTSDWLTNKTGLFVNNIANNFGFARIALNGSTDPAPGPKSPHYEMIFANLFFEKPGPTRPTNGSYFTIGTMLTSPNSRGTIKLASANPLDDPIIDPRFLTDDFDIVAMRESVKAVLRFAAAPAWSDWIAGRFGQAFQNATDDKSIDAYVRNLTISDMHPVGTAAMSKKGALSGVVDPNLMVKGTDGLRIVDASVFPRSPSLHSQGPVYLLAERAADIIKAAQVSSATTTTATSITSTTTTLIPIASGTVAHFGQCGGQGYTGATTCVAPFTCTFSNPFFSQCL
ncbi:hypothetical protein CVT25_005143 [Psilocybe cyanescens]|uniref:pyranose dehydrogenase (acceptor) n=1 Tax=Psilocybe cyanescens TaxID=93625 RepID=A0A409XBJ3_PSICY|nr:hypothetical protein CVT25_005143 [Psilocybe cyanescens]